MDEEEERERRWELHGGEYQEDYRLLSIGDVEDVSKVSVRTTSEVIRDRTSGMNRVVQTGGKIVIFRKGYVEVERSSHAVM